MPPHPLSDKEGSGSLQGMTGSDLGPKATAEQTAPNGGKVKPLPATLQTVVISTKQCVLLGRLPTLAVPLGLCPSVGTRTEVAQFDLSHAAPCWKVGASGV